MNKESGVDEGLILRFKKMFFENVNT